MAKGTGDRDTTEQLIRKVVLPARLEAALLVYQRVGLSTVLILFGLGVWAGWIPNPIARMVALLSVHVTEAREQQRELEGATWTLRQICRNLARTPEETKGCDPPPRWPG